MEQVIGMLVVVLNVVILMELYTLKSNIKKIEKEIILGDYD